MTREKKEALSFFMGSEEVAVDNRGRIRLPDRFYDVFTQRKDPNTVPNPAPPLYTGRTDNERYMLFDIRTLLQLRNIEEVPNWPEDEERPKIACNNVYSARSDKQHRINPRDKKLLDAMNNWRKARITASRGGEFLYLEQAVKEQ